MDASSGLLMAKVATTLAFGAFVFVAAIGASAAKGAGCGGIAATGAGCAGTELAAQKKRPRVTIYPRRGYPGPYAKRQCYSWLVTEYRVSGPVITPQMRCWWE
jgi:hypothetical protein